MECYFAVSKNTKNQLILDQEDTKHIIKVLRHKIDDEIIIIFEEKKYLTKITSLIPVVICQIVSQIDSDSELPIKVTLIMALLKEQKFDLVIQKAVELGVYCIVPIQLERSISTISAMPNKADSKIVRWQKIAKAAAKQSNRNIIPKIMPIVSKIIDLKQYQSEVNFLAYENAAINNWGQKLKGIKNATIVIGPEGGISEKELKNFLDLGFTNISLGKTILRAETAPIYFLSITNYYSVIES